MRCRFSFGSAGRIAAMHDNFLNVTRTVLNGRMEAWRCR